MYVKKFLRKQGVPERFTGSSAARCTRNFSRLRRRFRMQRDGSIRVRQEYPPRRRTQRSATSRVVFVGSIDSGGELIVENEGEPTRITLSSGGSAQKQRQGTGDEAQSFASMREIFETGGECSDSSGCHVDRKVLRSTDLVAVGVRTVSSPVSAVEPRYASRRSVSHCERNVRVCSMSWSRPLSNGSSEPHSWTAALSLPSLCCGKSGVSRLTASAISFSVQS